MMLPNTLLPGRGAAALALLTALTACTAKTSDPAPAAPLATAAWSVDGVLLNSTTSGEARLSADATANGALSLNFTVRSTPLNSDEIEHTVNLLLPGRVGTFTLPSTGSKVGYFIFEANGSHASEFAASSGSVTINSYTAGPALGDSHVVGTFAFVAPARPGSTGSKTITNGSFDVIF